MNPIPFYGKDDTKSKTYYLKEKDARKIPNDFEKVPFISANFSSRYVNVLCLVLP